MIRRNKISKIKNALGLNNDEVKILREVGSSLYPNSYATDIDDYLRTGHLFSQGVIVLSEFIKKLDKDKAMKVQGHINDIIQIGCSIHEVYTGNGIVFLNSLNSFNNHFIQNVFIKDELTWSNTLHYYEEKCLILSVKLYNKFKQFENFDDNNINTLFELIEPLFGNIIAEFICIKYLNVKVTDESIYDICKYICNLEKELYKNYMILKTDREVQRITTSPFYIYDKNVYKEDTISDFYTRNDRHIKDYIMIYKGKDRFKTNIQK